MSPRLTRLSDVTEPARLPSYAPFAHGVGIVHLGLGAFHCADQAVMTDDALSREGGDWRIVSVSLRSREMAEALSAERPLHIDRARCEGDAGSGRGLDRPCHVSYVCPSPI